MTIFKGEGFDTAGTVAPLLSDVVPACTRLDIGVGYSRPEGKTRPNSPNNNLRHFNTSHQKGVRLTLAW